MLFCGGVLLVLLILAGVLLKWPSLILNPDNLKMASILLEKQGAKITWEELKIHTQRVGLFRTKFFLDFKDPCFDVPSVQGCFSTSHMELEVGFEGFRPTLKYMGPFLFNKGSLTISSSPDQTWKIGIKNCKVDAKQIDASWDFGISCLPSLELSPAQTRLLPNFTIPSAIPMRFKGRVQLSQGERRPLYISGYADVNIDPLTIEGIHLKGNVFAQFGGTAEEFSKELPIQADLTGSAVIPSMRKLKNKLRGTPWAVPAPLNALEGNIRMMISGRATPEEISLPIQASTRLISKDQNLNLNMTGNLSVKKQWGVFRPYLDMNIDLADVQLVVPKVDPISLPTLVSTLVSDPRIKKSSRGAHSKTGPRTAGDLGYEIRIGTSRPIRIVSGYSNQPIPIWVNLNLSSKSPPTGEIHTKQAKVELFRRRALVENFRATFEGDRIPLNGKVRVDFAEYVIWIQLLGTSERPVFRLTSNPVLSEKDMLSVLLFGRRITELEPGQSLSIGSVGAALGARALDLASFYLLAATPIESVSYDPEVSGLSFAVRLAQGTSVRVTTSRSGIADWTVRKRIGNRWSITTGLSDPFRSGDSSLSAVLEWQNRY